MKAARMHEYGKAPTLEDIPVPDIQPDEILVNVKACGMCRSDVQLIDGYFRKYVDIPTPIGGLGGYAVQDAKLLGSGAKVVAFARNADKLNIARQNGADQVISIKGKSSVDIANELNQTMGQKDLDAIIDCAGAPEMVQLAFSLLSISGHYADVGLVGDRIDIPLFPRVSREQTLHGSYWGNNTDLSEVMALAAENKIRHSIKLFKFDEINQNIDLLRKGDIVGRAVMKF